MGRRPAVGRGAAFTAATHSLKFCSSRSSGTWPDYTAALTQFCHLHNVRPWHMETQVKDLSISKFETEKEPEKERLKENLVASGERIEKLLRQAAEGKGQAPPLQDLLRAALEIGRSSLRVFLRIGSAFRLDRWLKKDSKIPLEKRCQEVDLHEPVRLTREEPWPSPH